MKILRLIKVLIIANYTLSAPLQDRVSGSQPDSVHVIIPGSFIILFDFDLTVKFSKNGESVL